jgi:hypothetical protein
MKELTLDEGEREAFAHSALALKYDPEVNPSPVSANAILVPRRGEDMANNLWTVFNRVQESIIRGGVRGQSASGKRIKTRAVTGIDSDVRLNRAMWMLAEKMIELKA